VLALMNASNNSCSPAIIDYTEFYNTALDHTDLMKVFKKQLRFGLRTLGLRSVCDGVLVELVNEDA
jgi:hypothetical protein